MSDRNLTNMDCGCSGSSSGTSGGVVITNRMVMTEPLEQTQPAFTDPITLSLKGLNGFGTNGQIIETTGSQLQYRTAPIESNWINNNANLYPKDGVDENVLVGATTNPNSVKFYVTNGNAEINDTLKLTGTSQELQFVSNSQNKGIYFYTAAGTSAGWKMYGVSNQGGSARLEQLQNTQYMLELYSNDNSIDYYKFQRGTFDIRNQGSAVGQNNSAINFKDFNDSNNNKFRLDSNLDTKKFSLLYNSGSLDEDVMVFNCSTNTERQITFDKTLFYTINGDPSTTSDTIFKLSTNSNDITNGGNPIIQIQHKGLSGMSASWQLGDNGDVLFGGAGSATEKLKLYTSGGNIEFWGSQLGQTNQYGSINSTITDFLSTDTRVKRLKLRPNTHTTTIQENSSITGDITLTLPSTTGTLALDGAFQTPVWNVVNTTELIADPQEDDSNVCTKLTISSGAGSNGDCLLLIRADTDNTVETSNPRIQLQQDGTFVNAFVELADNDFLIGTTFSGSDTVLYTNSGTLAISNDSGSSQNIATFTSSLTDLKSTATKAVKLQTNTIEGTTTSTNTIVSQTDGWKITSQASNSTLILDNGNGSYTPYFSVDSSNSATVPIQILITNIGSAYVIGRDGGGQSQSNLQHYFYGGGINTNMWSGLSNQNNTITSSSSGYWEFQTTTSNQIALRNSATTYYPFIGTDTNSIPFKINLNFISGNVFEINNTNNTLSDISHRFFGGEVRVPKLVSTYQTNNEIVSESSGWIINANNPQLALRIRRIPTGGNYDPNIGTISDSIPFTISCGSLSEVYNIVNTLNTEAGIEHQFKGKIVCAEFRGDSGAGNRITDDATSLQISSGSVYKLSLLNNTSNYPYLGSNNSTVDTFFIHINGVSGNPYTISRDTGLVNSFRGNRTQVVTGEFQCDDLIRIGMIDNSFTSTLNLFLDINHATTPPPLPGATFIAFRYNAGLIGQVHQSGTSAVVYATTSDHRLKENVVECENILDKIDKFSVKEYNFISDREENINEKHIGFIAHEVQEIDERFSRFVMGEKDDIAEYCKCCQHFMCKCSEECMECDEEGNMINKEMRPRFQEIDYGKLTPVCIKGIQELHTIIKQQQEEINTYKSIIDKLVSAPSFKAFKESVA